MIFRFIDNLANVYRKVASFSSYSVFCDSIQTTSNNLINRHLAKEFLGSSEGYKHFAVRLINVIVSQ